MVSNTASTRQPPAGGPKATVDLGTLLLELRQGDRAAFVRYFRLFRTPVHHAASLLLDDPTAAVAATREALVGAFRRAILDEDEGDLEVITYSCLLEACAATAGSAVQGGPDGTGDEARREAPEGTEEPRGRRRSRGDDLRRRFAAALAALGPRRREALVLHDVAGLDAARSAAVFGIAEEAAAALLFRAREEFRAGLHAGHAGEACRQAEEATAGAVGRGFDAEELTRLRHHAAYCRPCRRTMKEWAGPAAGASIIGGLALVLAEPPLPQALAATPVFDEGAHAAAAGSRALAAGLLFRAGRSLRSRTAAWAFAVLCLAVAAGVVVHTVGIQPLVLVQSVGPAIRLIVAAPGDGSTPAEARPVERSTQGTGGTVGISAAGAMPTSSGVESPAASSAPTGAATPAATPTASASAAPSGSPVAGTGGARNAAKNAKVAKAAKTAARTARAKARADAKAAKASAKAAAKAARSSAKATKSNGKAAKSNGKAAKSNGKAAKSKSKAAKSKSKAARPKGKAAKSKGKAAKSKGKAAKSKNKAAKSKGHSRASHSPKKGG